MLILCVMPTAMMQFHRLIKNRIAKMTVNTVCIAFTVFTVIGRVFSGVHWITDILGGALLSAALIMLYYAVVQCFHNKKR